MRIVYESPTSAHNPIEKTFKQVASKYNMTWEMQNIYYKPRTLIMVSKVSHCLVNLLYKAKNGLLPIDIVGIVSNHPDLKPIAKGYQIPYFHLPLTEETKKEQESELETLIEKESVESIILARYMQILSNDFCEKYKGKIINIHHSFLPSFKGAKPYHQAYERGGQNHWSYCPLCLFCA